MYEKLLGAGYRFVSYRPRSGKEFRDFLTKKLVKWAPTQMDVLERVLERLTQLGYYDDEAFSVWWVSQRQTFRLKGHRYISHELKAKGIPQAIIAKVLGPLGGSKDEFEVARAALAAKPRLGAQLPPLERKMKLYGYLARKGFSSSVIHRVIDERLKKH